MHSIQQQVSVKNTTANNRRGIEVMLMAERAHPRWFGGLRNALGSDRRNSHRILSIRVPSISCAGTINTTNTINNTLNTTTVPSYFNTQDRIIVAPLLL